MNKHILAIFTLLSLTLHLTASAGQLSQTLNPYVPPSKNFNLKCWNLTLPIGKSGDPTVISTQQLVAGYQSTYFHTSSNDGGMLFWCPMGGATTKNTSNGRSELRETSPDGSGQLYNWPLSAGTAQLSGEVAITQVPSTGKVVFAQIHDTGIGTEDEPLIKMNYDSLNQTVYALVRTVPNKNTQPTYVLATNVQLGKKISYVISLNPERVLAMTVNGKTKAITIDPSWSKQLLYFKAGDYPQDSSGPPTEGGRVHYTALNIQHQ